jgi:hypothetical protein
LIFSLAASSAVSGPIPGQSEQLYSVPGTFAVRMDGAQASVGVFDANDAAVASYDISGCDFATGAPPSHGGDGVFTLLFPGVTEPMVAVSCHLPGRGQRFSIFAPERDRGRAILEVTGDSFVRFAIGLAALTLWHDRGGSTQQQLWHPGGTFNEFESERIRAAVVAAAGRKVPAPEPMRDPDLRELAKRLARIAVARDGEALVALAAPDILLSFGGNGGHAEFRALIAEPWFWPGFERALRGGGHLVTEWSDGRGAAFPALFQTWPDDLDAFDHLYGDAPGAKMRAGPSDAAPAIADLHGRIVADGPYPQDYERVSSDGWVNICTRAEGCGFARREHVRSPIDWRAIFTQTAPGAPWVLETYVAGD